MRKCCQEKRYFQSTLPLIDDKQFILGQIRVRLRFNNPLPNDLSIVVLAEFSSHLSLSKSGVVKTSYAAR